MPFEIHAHGQHGYFSLLTTVILALLVFVYSRGWFRLRSASPISFPPWRLAAFVGGLFALWIVLGSPLAALDHQLLTIHMMKHLLLMAVGAPLILLGAPALLLLCGLPKWFMHRSLLLRSRTPRLLGHFLSSPVFCWLAGTAAVIAWHVPAVSSAGSAMGRRADVGLRNVCLSDPGDRDYHPNPLARRCSERSSWHSV